MYVPNVKEQYFIWFFWIVGLTTLAELEREDQISFIKKKLNKKKNYKYQSPIIFCHENILGKIILYKLSDLKAQIPAPKSMALAWWAGMQKDGFTYSTKLWSVVCASS